MKQLFICLHICICLSVYIYVKHATELSKYVWSVKDKNILYNIKWRKVKQARSYSNVPRDVICVYGKNISLSVNPKCRQSTTEENLYL